MGKGGCPPNAYPLGELVSRCTQRSRKEHGPLPLKRQLKRRICRWMPWSPTENLNHWSNLPTASPPGNSITQKCTHNLRCNPGKAGELRGHRWRESGTDRHQTHENRDTEDGHKPTTTGLSTPPKQKLSERTHEGAPIQKSCLRPAGQSLSA